MATGNTSRTVVLFILPIAIMSIAMTDVTADVHRSTSARPTLPRFGSVMQNTTVIKGRDATFTCVVLNIGKHRVAWIKVDDKAILAMHEKVLINNARVSVIHSDLHTWTLQIRDAHPSDRGLYMCQVNSEPMLSQTATLEVVVPPDILNDQGAAEILVPEGGVARLSCKAHGHPAPRVTWRREDGQDIVIRSGPSQKLKVPVYEGEDLTFHKITRSEMGAYMCIASNNVPPSVSRRIVVNVHFNPIIQVHNQLIGAPIGSNITLDCLVEASPKPINYWARDTGEIIISNDKYRMEEIDVNTYTTRLRLHLRLSSSADEGGYKCCSKNSISDAEGTITVYATRQVEEEKPAVPSHWPDDEELNTEGADAADDSADWDEVTTTRRAAGPITPSVSPNSRRSSSNNHYEVHRAMQNKITTPTRSGSAASTCCHRHLLYVTFLLAVSSRLVSSRIL